VIIFINFIHFTLNFIFCSAVTADGKSMISSDDVTSFAPVSGNMRHLYAYGAQNVLKELYLIPLHPERINFQYGNVFDDINKTRVAEERQQATPDVVGFKLMPVVDFEKRKKMIDRALGKPTNKRVSSPNKQFVGEGWSRVWGGKAGGGVEHIDPDDSENE
jgi:hypothetical protein